MLRYASWALVRRPVGAEVLAWGGAAEVPELAPNLLLAFRMPCTRHNLGSRTSTRRIPRGPKKVQRQPPEPEEQAGPTALAGPRPQR